MSQADSPPPQTLLHRSTRDADWVKARLTRWFVERLGAATEPEVALHAGVDANGMSSETIVLSLTHTTGGQRRTHDYVARVAPDPADLPIFPTYRLHDQYRAMRLARQLAGVPTPPLGLFEETGAVLGTPFFLMDRVEGIVPPDVLPYTFGDNWLFNAGPEEQARLQSTSVAILARLHAIPDAASIFSFLDPAVTGHVGDTLLARNVAKTAAWYQYAIAGDTGNTRSPLIERALTWLAANLPTDSGEPVLVWGDARIGNMMYVDFAPVAVLDWEMATLGTREMDLAWLVFAHEVFQEIATTFGLPGMPHFLTPAQVTATYTELTGAAVGDLTWHRLHSAVLWACVFLRTSIRQIRFGEIERPQDPEGVYYHRSLFERLLSEVGA